jgi:hypothetical protein
LRTLRVETNALWQQTALVSSNAGCLLALALMLLLSSDPRLADEDRIAALEPTEWPAKRSVKLASFKGA